MGESLPPPWDFWGKEAKSVREWERVSPSRRFFGRKKLKVHGNGRLNRIYSMRREAEENLPADDEPAANRAAACHKREAAKDQASLVQREVAAVSGRRDCFFRCWQFFRLWETVVYNPPVALARASPRMHRGPWIMTIS